MPAASPRPHAWCSRHGSAASLGSGSAAGVRGLGTGGGLGIGILVVGAAMGGSAAAGAVGIRSMAPLAS